jgi:polyisoprenoid-binding protein YceI
MEKHMNRIDKRMAACGLVMASAMVAARGVAAAPDAWSIVEVRGGNASFDAATNVSAISVHGKSTQLDARASVRDGSDGLVLESVEATLPVKSLATGMGLRDEHMRKLVFTNPDGSVPDVKFVSKNATCAPDAAKRHATCAVSGQLAIRGILRPFTMTLVVSREGNDFRAAGDGILKLSTYGIDQPSQFGVRTQDDVKLHLDFTARPANMTARNANNPRNGAAR